MMRRAFNPVFAAMSPGQLVTKPVHARALASTPIRAQKSLAQHDPELFSIIQDESTRQHNCLELIASENFTSRAVIDCLGSCLTNKYSEGLPGARYYGGQVNIDKIENLCRDRALEAYKVDPSEWAVNVQPYSGSPANMAVYTALLKPGQKLMGLDLPSGGHLTHGYQRTMKDGSVKAISASSYYFKASSYAVNQTTGLLDMELIAEQVEAFKPDLLICGGSAYPRGWDYAKFREIADSVGAYLMCDMAHISGLVATGEADSPFDHCDVVTTTTHKSLRGPRAGMIFSKIDDRKINKAIDFAVFPMLQGGPHIHQIAGVATQLKEAMTPEFKTYIQAVRANSSALADELTALGHTITSGGTDNHLFLWDLRSKGLSGAKMEKACELAGITLNKNTIVGDDSAMTPGGVRIGLSAMTTRGLDTEGCKVVASLLDRVCQQGLVIQSQSGKKLSDYNPAAEKCEVIAGIAKEIEQYVSGFPMPGVQPTP